MASEPSRSINVTLGSIAKFRSGSAFKPDEQGHRSGDIPFIKVSDLNLAENAHKIIQANNWISKGAIPRLKVAIHPAGATVFAKIGIALTYNRRRLLTRDTAIDNNLMSATPFDSHVSPNYLYHILRCIDFNEVAKGSALPYLNVGDLQKIEVRLPPQGEQERICETLDALDDRIDLLRQTNATLEAIAQALFKSWFVDFDPVRAKVEGREPEGMDAETAALFPSEFEESELGLIPRGWAVSTLEEHVDAERGLSYKGAGLADAGTGLPMHTLNSVLEGGGYKYSGIKFYSGDFKARHIASAGDIIVANTEQGHQHRLIGFPAIVPRQYKRGLFSHHLYRLRIREGSPITRHWLYHALMTPSVRDQIIGCANGSTVNMLKPAGMQIPRLAVPTKALCELFDQTAGGLRERLEANVVSAEVLSDLRDTLLPRLISGKLRLPEAQAIADEALA